MKIMGNPIVNLEFAKYLKSQGYSKPCEYYYLDADLPFCNRGLKRTKNGETINHNNYDSFIYSAPTSLHAIDYCVGKNIKYETSIIFNFCKNK